MIRRRVVVYGVVQGVFFRDTCRAQAERLGVTGWVRNLPEGTVEAAFEGDRDRVERLLEWSRQGPDEAEVTGVEVFVEEPEGLAGFAVRATPSPRR